MLARITFLTTVLIRFTQCIGGVAQTQDLALGCASGNSSCDPWAAHHRDGTPGLRLAWQACSVQGHAFSFTIYGTKVIVQWVGHLFCMGSVPGIGCGPIGSHQ